MDGWTCMEDGHPSFSGDWLESRVDGVVKKWIFSLYGGLRDVVFFFFFKHCSMQTQCDFRVQTLLKLERFILIAVAIWTGSETILLICSFTKFTMLYDGLAPPHSFHWFGRFRTWMFLQSIVNFNRHMSLPPFSFPFYWFK